MARKNALDNRQRTAVKEAGMGMKSIIVWLVSLALKKKPYPRDLPDLLRLGEMN